MFGIDPQNPDPGRVTIRRLNRSEYRNTIRDLMGIDFNTDLEFPPDDTGHGFDNIGDVLTLSPMLIEKYLAAAKTIVDQAVPAVSRVIPESKIAGNRFLRAVAAASGERPDRNKKEGPLSLSYYESASVSNIFPAPHDGRYQLALDLTANEKYVEAQFDYNKCRLVFKVDGQELLQQEYVRQGGKAFHYEFNRDWQAGEHELVFELQPLTPDEKQVRTLTIRIDSVTVRGPQEEKYWVRPANYERFFTSEAPEDSPARRKHAQEVLEKFAAKAFRRPVDAEDGGSSGGFGRKRLYAAWKDF